MQTLDELIAQKQKVNPISGVYFLFLGNQLQYIGQSKDVPNRLAQHQRTPICEFDSHFVLATDPDQLRLVEWRYIDALSPPYNTGLNTSRHKESLGILPEKRLGVVTPLGFFKNMQAAARAHGIDRYKVDKWVKSHRLGWAMFREIDE